jgi:hypothetical protein
MRTIALIAGMGILAAAEAPKSKPAADTPAPRLTTAEIVALSSLADRMKALKAEFDGVEKQFSQVRSEACSRAIGEPGCEIKPDGTIAKVEAKK